MLTDTSSSAADRQTQALRELSGAQRMALALEMSQAARTLLTARLRKDHPTWPEADIARESLRLILPGAVLPAALR